MLRPFKAPVSRTPVSSPSPSPFHATAAKRDRPALLEGSGVVPEAKRFDVATKVDDTEMPEHLWNRRALKVDQVPTRNE
jgi:hypothetical protein